MTTIRGLFADDEAGDYGELTGTVKAAFREIHRDLSCDIEPLTSYQGAKDRLEDTTRQLDLVFIDVLWDRTKVVQGCDDLLRRSLPRLETVSILISRAESELTARLYDPARASLRPHAVVHKDSILSESVFRGVLEQAFSVARLPLRSRTLHEAKFSTEVRNLPTIDELSAFELAAAVTPHVTDLEITQIGGGLSGAVTMLVRTAGPRGMRRFMLKAERDARILAEEASNHADAVKAMPGNTFAALTSTRQFEYGGWFAIAFDVASGTTVSHLGATFVDSDAWLQVFPTEMFEALEPNGRIARAKSYSELITASHASLTPDRLVKAAKAAATLNLPAAVQDFFRMRPEEMFRLTASDLFLTVAHNDLHTRNVMVSLSGSSGRATWVDAASMKSDMFWPSDPARFATWLACELADDDSIDHRELMAALDISTNSPSNSWAAKLRGHVHRTLDVAKAQYSRHDLDFDRDWRVGVAFELMRVTYSEATFDRKVRQAAALAAYHTVNDCAGRL